jgi:hypothetical protein
MYVKKEMLFLSSELEEKAAKLLMVIVHCSVYYRYLFHEVKVPLFGANLTFAVPEYVDGSLAGVVVDDVLLLRVVHGHHVVYPLVLPF